MDSVYHASDTLSPSEDVMRTNFCTVEYLQNGG
jgi:hypothetical protein